MTPDQLGCFLMLAGAFMVLLAIWLEPTNR